MRSTLRNTITALLALALSTGVSYPAHAVPSSSVDSATVSTPELEAARDRALELETQIEELRGERISLEERIDVTNQLIFRQQEILADVRVELAEARATYQDRMVRMYKSRIVDPLAILLTAESISDLYTRIMMLSRISQRDQLAFKNASIATSEAEYQAAYLDELKRQDVELRQIQAIKIRTLDAALVEQNALIATLTEDALEQLLAVRATNTLTRKEWRDSSVPIGGEIQTAQATVEPYEGITYTVAAYQPTRYRSTGKIETMVCSWYGNEFNGRPTASGQIFNEEDLTCASKTLPFGTRLALTRGNLRIIVVVTDRGPFVAGRDLDLSKAAARLLGFSGVEPVQAEFVEALK